MVKNMLRFVLISLVIMLALSACGSDKKEKKTAENTPETMIPVTFQLSWVHEAANAGIYAAIDQGYYAREGIDITLKEGGFSDAGYIDPVANVMNGTAQFGISNGQQLLVGRDSGDPVVMIAVLFQRTPRVFISLADSGITRPQDFVGKRVAVREDIGAMYEPLYRVAGINAEDVIQITDPTLFTPEALVNGEVDVIPVFITSEVVELEQQGHPVNIIVLSDYGIEDFQNLVFTTQATIDQNPDLVDHFLRATLDGFKYAVDNPTETAKLVAQYTQGDPAFEDASMSRTVPLIQVAGTPIGHIDTATWDAFVDMLVQQGTLSGKDNVAGAYNLTFLDKIQQPE